MLTRSLAAAILIALIGLPAQAGSLTGGAWAPSACGAEPTAPRLHTESASSYNESIKWVQLYQKQIKTYNDCMVAEAKADVAAVDAFVQAEQRRVNGIFEEYTASTNALQKREQDSAGGPQVHQRGAGLH
jgi:hypothetical protein